MGLDYIELVPVTSQASLNTEMFDASNSISAFPNPTTGIVTVENVAGEVFVQNTFGKTIRVIQAKGGKAVIDLSKSCERSLYYYS